MPPCGYAHTDTDTVPHNSAHFNYNARRKLRCFQGSPLRSVQNARKWQRKRAEYTRRAAPQAVDPRDPPGGCSGRPLPGC